MKKIGIILTLALVGSLFAAVPAQADPYVAIGNVRVDTQNSSTYPYVAVFFQVQASAESASSIGDMNCDRYSLVVSTDNKGQFSFNGGNEIVELDYLGGDSYSSYMTRQYEAYLYTGSTDVQTAIIAIRMTCTVDWVTYTTEKVTRRNKFPLAGTQTTKRTVNAFNDGTCSFRANADSDLLTSCRSANASLLYRMKIDRGHFVGIVQHHHDGAFFDCRYTVIKDYFPKHAYLYFNVKGRHHRTQCRVDSVVGIYQYKVTLSHSSFHEDQFTRVWSGYAA